MSSDLIETRLSQISDRIRKGRENKHLTLVELGLRSGVAPSTIQKIENRQMTPSIVVILKIAAGLGLEGGDLIAPPSRSPRDTIIQRRGQHARIVVSKALMFEKLSADILGSELECWRIVIAAGHEMKLSSPAAMGEQIVFCERGQVELEFGSQVYRLRAGDTLHCLPQPVHRIANPGDVEAAYTMSGRFPHSAHAAFTAELNGRSSHANGRSQPNRRPSRAAV
jgi:transcriptional regulator with XRE-family HTH domain